MVDSTGGGGDAGANSLGSPVRSTSKRALSPGLVPPQSPPQANKPNVAKPGMTPEKIRKPPTAKMAAFAQQMQLNLDVTDAGGAAKKKFCNCKNSRCLKLYCECFAAGAFCENCNCVGCCNNAQNDTLHKAAVTATLDRNPSAFMPKIAPSPVGGQLTPMSSKHNRGCNCKKSGCLKKYCECFQAGIVCSENCKCCQCKNFDGSGELSSLRKSLAASGGANGTGSALSTAGDHRHVIASPPSAKRQKTEHSPARGSMGALLAAKLPGGQRVDSGGKRPGSASKPGIVSKPPSGGIKPGVTSKAPGSASKAPGSAGKAPGSAGKAPGSAGKAGGTSKPPGSGGKAPANGSKAPGSGSKAPGSGSKAPGSGSKAPGSGGKDKKSTPKGGKGSAPPNSTPDSRGSGNRTPFRGKLTPTIMSSVCELLLSAARDIDSDSTASAADQTGDDIKQEEGVLLGQFNTCIADIIEPKREKVLT